MGPHHGTVLMASTLSDVLTLLGIVGVSGIAAAARFSRRWGRHYRFFRLQRGEPVDIVLTTSAGSTQGGYGQVNYQRPTTSVGNMKAATELAQAIGYGSRRRRISVSGSAELETRLAGDVVVIGLPGKNAASRLMIDHLRVCCPSLGLEIDELAVARMALDGVSHEYMFTPQEGSDLPSYDLAFILFWVNPVAVRKRRLIVCGGFTTYGTAAAARYLVEDIRDTRLGALRRRNPSMPRLWRRRWTCFVAILEIRFVHDQAVEVIERKFVALDDPGIPPFGPMLERQVQTPPATDTWSLTTPASTSSKVWPSSASSSTPTLD